MLTRDEVKALIATAVEAGVFELFFKIKEEKTEEAVEALFDEIFLDVFIDQDDEMVTEE